MTSQATTTTRRTREEIIANSVREEYNEWSIRNQKSPDNYFGVPVWSQFGKNVAFRAAPELEKQAKLDFIQEGKTKVEFLRDTDVGHMSYGEHVRACNEILEWLELKRREISGETTK